VGLRGNRNDDDDSERLLSPCSTSIRFPEGTDFATSEAFSVAVQQLLKYMGRHAPRALALLSPATSKTKSTSKGGRPSL
jgi:hypothetical protein